MSEPTTLNTKACDRRMLHWGAGSGITWAKKETSGGFRCRGRKMWQSRRWWWFGCSASISARKLDWHLYGLQKAVADFRTTHGEHRWHRRLPISDDTYLIFIEDTSFSSLERISWTNCTFLLLAGESGFSGHARSLQLIQDANNASGRPFILELHVWSQEQPNPVVDAYLYGAGTPPGVLKFLVDQFPEGIMQKHVHGKLPFEILLERRFLRKCNATDENDTVDNPPLPSFVDVVDIRLNDMSQRQVSVALLDA